MEMHIIHELEDSEVNTLALHYLIRPCIQFKIVHVSPLGPSPAA